MSSGKATLKSMPEFHLLLERLFDGGLRGDERERFNAILRQNRQARHE